MKRFLSLPENTRGRDFIVGDLHGCVALLMQLLAAVGFDPKVDRLFCVGDLCDRGPDSLKTLELLLEPWVYAVPGNHDVMLLCYLNRRASYIHTAADFLRNGGDWVLDLSDAERVRLDIVAEKVAQLPLTIAVGGAAPFNVTHGDLTPLGLSQDAVQAEETVDPHVGDLCMWNRDLVHTPDAVRELTYDGIPFFLSDQPLLSSLHLTYVGHTILRAPLLHKSHCFIDCGGYVSAKPDAARNHPSARLQLIEHRPFHQWLQQVTGPAAGQHRS